MSVLLIVPVELASLLDQELEKLESELKEACRAGNHKKVRRLKKRIEEINEPLDGC